MFRNLSRIEVLAILFMGGVLIIAAIFVVGVIGLSMQPGQQESVSSLMQPTSTLAIQDQGSASSIENQQSNKSDAPVEAPSVSGGSLAQAQPDEPVRTSRIDCGILLNASSPTGALCELQEEHNFCEETYSVYIVQGYNVDPQKISIIFEALEEACRVYNPLLGAGMDVDILVGPDNIISSIPAQKWVDFGWVYATDVLTTCFMVIPPSFHLLPINIAKQTVAHELFHCKQRELTIAAPTATEQAVNKWWKEGSAEFFSNIVYPTYNSEHIRATSFDKKSDEDDGSITSMSYETWLFFQYIANKTSLQFVIDILWDIEPKNVIDLSDIRTVHAQHQSQLRSFIDQNFFHDFGKAYLDKTIRDPGEGLGGGAIPTDPFLYFKRWVDLSGSEGTYIEETLEAPPFVVRKYQFVYDPGKVYHHRISLTNGNGLISAKEMRDNSSWGDLPEEVVTPCESPLFYPVLITTTGPQNVSFQITTEISDNEDCEEPLPSNSSCDVPDQNSACLIGGTWTADLSQWIPYYVLDVSPDNVDVIGRRELTFNGANNTATYTVIGEKITRLSCAGDKCDGVEISAEIPQAVVSYEVVDGNFLTSIPISIQGEVTIKLVGGNNDEEGRTTPLTTESLSGNFGMSPASDNQSAGVVHGRFVCTPKKLIICSPEGFSSVPKETIYTR